MIQKKQIEIKLGQYGTAPATALDDPSILPDVQHYKRRVASRLVPLSQTDIDRRIPEAQYHVSRKIDGEFCCLIFRDGSLFTINPGGTVRTGFHWEAEAVERFKTANVTEAFIAGELYADVTDRRPRVHDVVSVARQPEDEEDLRRLRLAVFDLISINQENCSGQTYDQKWREIQRIFASGTAIHPVETESVQGTAKVKKLFTKWVETEAGEGIVVRSDSVGNFKIKPKHTIDAAVIGFSESTGDRQGMIHDLLLAVARSDGALQVLCRVGGGFSEDVRREMFSDLNDMVVTSQYAEVNSDHVAYQMVRPDWVVEISCLDVIAQNTRGGPINRMVLHFNPKEQQYEVVRRMPLVSVISPQFIRIREDKSCNPNDVRISQITDIVPVAKSTIDADGLTLPKSELLQRKVFTKTLKGATMVRKFLVWKTNKQDAGESFPAYVLHYTDFSPNRKIPLAREVRISDDEDQIHEFFEQFIADNIKKGWAEAPA